MQYETFERFRTKLQLSKIVLLLTLDTFEFFRVVRTEPKMVPRIETNSKPFLVRCRTIFFQCTRLLSHYKLAFYIRSIDICSTNISLVKTKNFSIVHSKTTAGHMALCSINYE